MRILENNIKNILIKIAKIIFVILILAFAIQYVPNIYKNIYISSVDLFSNSKVILVGDTMVKVEIADTNQKRIQGLSGVEKLEKNTGMLFVFEKADLYGIWMKDMNFPIDIIWMNQYRQIIHIVEDAKPESYPETFLPPTSSLYILEVPSGFVQEQGVKIGDSIVFY